jgi:hypothetical protein
MAVDSARDPLAWVLLDIAGQSQLQPLPLGGGDECLTEDVRRETIHRCRQPQQLGRVNPVSRMNFSHLRGADGQRPGLVEQDRPGLAERLDRSGSP